MSISACDGIAENPPPPLVGLGREADQAHKGRGSKRRWLIPLPPIYNNRPECKHPVRSGGNGLHGGFQDRAMTSDPWKDFPP